MVLRKHLLTKSEVMINKRVCFVADFHPAAFNYNGAIKESSPLAANSEWLQKESQSLQWYPSNSSNFLISASACEERLVHFLQTRMTQQLSTYGNTQQFLISDVTLFLPACDSHPDNKQSVQEGKEGRDSLGLLRQSPKQHLVNPGFAKQLKLHLFVTDANYHLSVSSCLHLLIAQWTMCTQSIYHGT